MDRIHIGAENSKEQKAKTKAKIVLQELRCPAYNKAAIGYTIRRLRREREIPQYLCALDAGLNPSYFSQVENGQCRITVHKLAQVCYVLDVSLSDFFVMLELPNQYGLP